MFVSKMWIFFLQSSFLKLLTMWMHTRASCSLLENHKHSHFVAGSSASRQRKWFLLLFPCVVLHQAVGSCWWVGVLWRPWLMSVLLCVQSLSASPLFSSSASLLRPAAAGGPKREPSRESRSTEGLLSPFSQHWQ